MTKQELLEIQDFIEDTQVSDDQIEVFERIYRWIKAKYKEQGKKKLGDDFKDLITSYDLI